ncbi:hypothetical protein EIP91_007934 [Steccherinum ochraceum]|uniref:SUN domain-containing protein n=1 Tax=Steccherinum ochraceum TaxID=92696 RepID=A0A4R0RYK1_9APHY|nr:hypothetical protein EIP91_007934 [Steccherinum ochraceum]
MSFSSTPLGQGRRLDHHTFLNKPTSGASASNYITRPSSPPRRQIPTSYAYGASTAGTRSPPKPSSSQSTGALETDDADQPALVRFARLKQRDPIQPAHSAPNLNATAAPRSKPEKWSVKDTSVQIASAFHQAATTSFDTSGGSTSNNMSYSYTNPNDAWTSGITRHTVPRSSSVEYEKETQLTAGRRLGVPPSRVNRVPNRTVAKSVSLNHVPDSEPEEEQASQARKERGKSPFEQVVDVARSFAPTSFFLRSPSKEPEERVNGANGDHQNTSSSYDYSAEEREYQNASQKPTSKRGPAHKRNRISVDNKAYRPSMSDLESDDDFEEDGKKTKRRKSKKGLTGGGPLTTLPVASYDKRRKKRKGGKTNGADEDEGSSEEQQEEQEQEEQSRVSEQRSVRGTTPVARAPSRAPSVPRLSVPPPSRMSVPRTSAPPPDTSYRSDPDASMDVEQALHSISEVEEPPEVEDEQITKKKSFSVGASLGRTVHWAIALFWRLASSLLMPLSFFVSLLTRTLQLAAELLILKPLQTLQTNSFALAKYAVLALSMYLAWQGVQSGFNPFNYVPSLPTIRPSAPAPYTPPESLPADFSALASRLHNLETTIASLSRDSQRSIDYLEDEAKTQADITDRLGSLETRIHRESARVQDVETKLRTATSQELKSVRHQVEVLSAQIQAERKDTDSRFSKIGGNKEIKTLLKGLEDRLTSIEGETKEAVELAKQSSKVDSPTDASIAWLNNVASGKSAGVTIKSSDGQDVTSLLSLLVDSAITRYSKDTIARRDFAMHSSGARIIPALTSDTFEVRPSTTFGQVVGMITGNGYAIGRAPVTILNHENHDGYCWPFAGTQGQVGVALSAPALITDITIDHVALDIATDIRSAPRQMEVWGLVEGQDNLEKVMAWWAQKAAAREAAGEAPPDEYADYPSTLPRSPSYIRIASFTYDIHAPKHIQTFPVDQEIKTLGVDFGVVVLVVNNNWGKDEYTCVYRMRVHGQRLGGIPIPDPDAFDHSR